MKVKREVPPNPSLRDLRELFAGKDASHELLLALSSAMGGSAIARDMAAASGSAF